MDTATILKELQKRPGFKAAAEKEKAARTFSFTPSPRVGVHRGLIDALTALRRKSKLSYQGGIAKPEKLGVTGGYFSTAADRLAQLRQGETAERGLAYQKWYGERMLTLEEERLKAEKKAARRAGKGGLGGFL